MQRIFAQLDGHKGNQIKLIIVLLGTIGNGSFRVSEKWIQEQTGMPQSAYSKARKSLIEKGWMVLTDDGCIVVDVNAIMGD